MELIEIMQKAGRAATEAGNPVNFEYGTVKSVSPLTVFVNAKKILDENFLMLTNSVKDYYVDMEVGFMTGVAGSPPHSHNVTKTIKVLVKNGLKEGERVLLVRVQGGQKYIVIDRLSEHITEGEG